MVSILIIDDSNMLRDMLKHTLNDGGYSDITEAKDGEDGLKKANMKKFDLIITDINMPKINGLEFIKKLRLDNTYSKIPILILTTERGDNIKQDAKNVGATGWIDKPFLPDQLLEAVRLVLERG
jgi:two-component system chemotaxis response regulator CheY